MDCISKKSLSLLLANDANRWFNIDIFVRGVSCLDLITQSTPPVSINECVLCLHLLAEDSKTVLGHADKTCSSAATDSWELSFCSLFLYLDLDFGNGNGLFGATQRFCDWSKKILKKGFLLCWMQCGGSTLGMHMKSKLRTWRRQGKYILTAQSWLLPHVAHYGD